VQKIGATRDNRLQVGDYTGAPTAAARRQRCLQGRRSSRAFALIINFDFGVARISGSFRLIGILFLRFSRRR
jgi:hypothetical protein